MNSSWQIVMWFDAEVEYSNAIRELYVRVQLNANMSFEVHLNIKTRRKALNSNKFWVNLHSLSLSRKP